MREVRVGNKVMLVAAETATRLETIFNRLKEYRKTSRAPQGKTVSRVVKDMANLAISLQSDECDISKDLLDMKADENIQTLIAMVQEAK